VEAKSSASDLAKRKLILAAIRLFAEHGVDSISLRMINRAAGHRNNSALHYHFGSKLGLIAAVDAFIQAHFDHVRGPALQRVEQRAESGAITVAEVLEVITMPYVEIIEQHDWGYPAVRTIARMEFDGNREVQALLGASAAQAARRIARLLRPLLPDLPPREFRRRLNHVSRYIIHGFADYRNLDQSYFGNLAVRHLRDLQRFYVRMGTADLTAAP